ncbi:hypothetical protein [Moraxella lacunata]|uniref:hypothetical protein n=1 Tax=Moraxella lacunata TaxID=477 RepID=UPI0015F0A05F|nr:hypothetical protein [Moraxella lacunata]
MPSKKALWQDNNLETALIDATEIPIERPKKAKATALMQIANCQRKRQNLNL